MFVPSNYIPEFSHLHYIKLSIVRPLYEAHTKSNEQQFFYKLKFIVM